MKSIEKKRADNEKLLERLTKFSERLIKLCQRLPKVQANILIIAQLIPSGTSMGANYNEACEAESAKDFVHKIRISKKEAKETKYWLRLLKAVKENNGFVTEIEELYREADEYLRIFSSIVSKFKT